jgi:hypothetical protein
MSMKIVTKLDYGHNFNKSITEFIDHIIEVNKKEHSSQITLAIATKQLVEEVRKLVKDAYSMGVEQGIIKSIDVPALLKEMEKLKTLE